jgi:hypothetical protein
MWVQVLQSAQQDLIHLEAQVASMMAASAALKTLVDLADNQVASMMAASVAHKISAASVADHKTLVDLAQVASVVINSVAHKVQVVSAQQDLAHKAQLPHF